jgi:hypothetical protein
MMMMMMGFVALLLLLVFYALLLLLVFYALLLLLVFYALLLLLLLDALLLLLPHSLHHSRLLYGWLFGIQCSPPLKIVVWLAVWDSMFLPVT